MSDGCIVPGDLDPALCNMIRAAEGVIRAWIRDSVTLKWDGADWIPQFSISDIDWDSPASPPEDATDVDMDDGDHLQLREASHAIGFICGVAAGLTPLTLLDNYDTKPAKKSRKRARK